VVSIPLWDAMNYRVKYGEWFEKEAVPSIRKYYMSVWQWCVLNSDAFFCSVFMFAGPFMQAKDMREMLFQV